MTERGIGTRSAAPDFLDDPDVRPACRGADTARFFGSDHAQAGVIAVYCTPCEIRPACREWALAQSPESLYGVWGGLTRNQRRDIRRRRLWERS
ncbi:WhiB family transcriptional regulator [Micromonospora sp. NPDC047707]|uniref:WhiB family transcriptional regulator n=1 Tax=Micromonospora sp. NPDC047707 TaxID=3154498 RepID=UPI00345408B3